MSRAISAADGVSVSDEAVAADFVTIGSLSVIREAERGVGVFGLPGAIVFVSLLFELLELNVPSFMCDDPIGFFVVELLSSSDRSSVMSNRPFKWFKEINNL